MSEGGVAHTCPVLCFLCHSFLFLFPIISLMLKRFSKQTLKVSTLFTKLIPVFTGLQEMNGNE